MADNNDINICNKDYLFNYKDKAAFQNSYHYTHNTCVLSKHMIHTTHRILYKSLSINQLLFNHSRTKHGKISEKLQHTYSQHISLLFINTNLHAIFMLLTRN